MKSKSMRNPTKAEWEREIARIRSWRSVDVHGPPPSDPKERERWMAIRENVAAAADIDRDLMCAGLPVGLADLSQARLPYPQAIDVLVRHLRHQYPRDVEEAIVRALTVPYAGERAFEALLTVLQERLSARDSQWQFAIGNALAEVAEEKHKDALQMIAAEPKFASARYMPIVRLGKLAKRHHEIPALLAKIASGKGAEVAYALHALRLARAWCYKDLARRALNSRNDFVREEATKYLRAAEKASV